MVKALRRGLDAWIDFVDGRRDRTLGFAVALFLSVAILPALGQIDGILQANHRPGDAAYAMASLSGSLTAWPKTPQRAGEIAAAWVDGSTPGFTGAGTLARAYVLLDVLFILAYGWVLAVLALRVRHWLSASAQTSWQTTLQRRMAGGRALALACGGVVVLALVDLAEAALQAFVAAGCIQAQPLPGCSSGLLSWALYVSSALKWSLFAAIALTIVFGFLALVSLRRARLPELGRVLVRLRTPLVLVVFLGFAYLVKASPFAEQAADLLRRWQDQEQHAVAAVVLTGVLAIVILTCARGLVGRVRPDAASEPSTGSLWIAAGGAVIVGVLAMVVWPQAPGLLALGVLLVILAAISALTGPVPSEPPGSAGDALGARGLPALLGAAPLVVLGLAVQGAALVEVAWAGHHEYIVWLVTGVVLQALGWWAYYVFVNQRGGTSVVLVVLGVVVVLMVTIWTWLDPWGAADIVGGAGIIAAFAIAVMLAGFGLGQVAEVTVPPRALRMLGFRRTPFVVLLLLWGVAAAILDEGGVHDARLLGEPAAEQTLQPGLTLEEVFDRWREGQGLPPAPGAGAALPDQVSGATPLVIVSASGGGIRAAFWTASTLECLFGAQETGPCAGPARDHTQVLAASGVSGGSLGVTAWRTHERTPNTDDWVGTLRADMLTPTVAWALFVDLPNSLVHTDRLPDRAEILERSWEREWLDDAPIGADALDARSPLAKGLFETGDDTPLLMLNGTAVETGCRFNVSVLRANVEQKRRQAQIEDCLSVRAFEPDPGFDKKNIDGAREEWALGASVDANEFVCRGTDLRLSTAALLSARFPYVSPSGRLTACGQPDISTYLVDGGYFDSSAAETSAQLWTALEPIVEHYNEQTGQCVMPFAIQIDNGYDEPPGPDPGKRPLESMAPLKTVLGSRDAREADARQALALAVSKPVGNIRNVTGARAREVRRYAHIYPRAHPGIQAPLGWALSKSTQTDLSDQLRSGPNAEVVKHVRDTWLTPDTLTCAPQSVGGP